MPDYTAMLQAYQTKIAEQRLLLTQWATTVVEQYDNLPEEVRATLPALPGRTAKEMVPALWAEPVTDADAENYKQQVAILQDFVSACNAKVAELNALEAVRCKLS